MHSRTLSYNLHANPHNKTPPVQTNKKTTQNTNKRLILIVL